MADYCHYIRDKEAGRVFLPGCMGGAVYGPYGCTCEKPSRSSLERRIEKLEKRVKQLESMIGCGGDQAVAKP